MSIDTSATRGWSIEDKIAYHSKPSDDGCRLWTAAIASGGYGQIWHLGRSALAHRVVLALKLGRTIRSDREAGHTCHNRLCVNPEHLEEVTHKQNILDRTLSGRGARGERAGSAKLTETLVRCIRKDTRSERTIARDYGVSPSTIHDIKNRHSWGHIDD